MDSEGRMPGREPPFPLGEREETGGCNLSHGAWSWCDCLRERKASESGVEGGTTAPPRSAASVYC